MARTLVSRSAYGLKDAANWWDFVNESHEWQNRIFHVLAALYGIVAGVALVILFPGTISSDTIESSLVWMDHAKSFPFFQFPGQWRLYDICCLMCQVLHFSTYALLVLFWAEIYYQARAVSTDGLRSSFLTINAVVYAIQIVLWLVIWWKPIPVLVILSKIFFAGVSLFAALGFLLYGGRLFLTLQRFPVESKGRRTKLQEMCFNAFDKAANLDVVDHPVLNFIYFLLVEILPSSLVLFFLRKLPPKRGITQYHPIR